MGRTSITLSGLALLAVGLSTFATSIGGSDTAPIAQEDFHVRATGTALPLAFERNEGQADPAVRFVGRGPGYRVFLTDREAITVLEATAAVRMRLEGANPAPRITASEPFTHSTNYLIGNDPSEHVKDVPSFRRVKYSAVYPGIDLAFYGNEGQLEYDLELAPGADPDQIRISFTGAQRLRINKAGELALDTGDGQIIYRQPFAYQERDGKRQAVEVAYTMRNGQVSFVLGKYDATRSLVIDPILAYSSFLWDGPASMAVDAAGNAYIFGMTQAADLPVTSGAYQSRLRGTQDLYVIKLDPAATRILYATYIGGRRGITWAYDIAVDAAGNAYLSGATQSSSYPVTSGAFQTTFVADTGLLTKLDASGSALVYSTFLNGARIYALDIDAAGNAYMAGQSVGGGSFPLVNPVHSNGGCIVAQLNAAGSALGYSSRLGGERCNGLARDAAGNVYVAGTTRFSAVPIVNAYQPTMRGGQEAFAAKINSAHTALDYATYIGGTADDFGNDIAVSASGEAVVVGRTHSDDFPTTFGSFQPAKALAGTSFSNAFVTKLSSSGSALLYSSYLGGRWCLRPGTFSCFGDPGDGIDGATSVAVDAAGYAYVGGYSASAEFPLVDSPQGMRYTGSENDRIPFAARVAPGGERLIYSLVLGVPGWTQSVHGVALDAAGNAYFAGYNGSAGGDYPTTAGTTGFGGGFIYKLVNGAHPTTIESWSPRPAKVGQTVTIKARVLNPTPGGTVTFRAGAAQIGSVPALDGLAILQVNLPAGAHEITATYDLDERASTPEYVVVTSQ